MNHKLLTEFTTFCNTHPELTFWRALLQWVQEKHDKGFARLLFYKNKHLYDTVNWTGEDSPVVLFKDDVTINVIHKE